jgi:hypothetical protein
LPLGTRRQRVPWDTAQPLKPGDYCTPIYSRSVDDARSRVST